MSMKQLSLILFALAFTTPGQAKVFKWTDADGSVHFTDSNAQKADAKPLQMGPRPAEPAKKQLPIDKSSIVLYVSSSCLPCDEAKEFLNRRNIPFKEYDVENDSIAAAQKYTLAPGYGGIPLAVIYGKIIKGFAENDYKAALVK
ncbi:hypothetical protein JCM14076_14230 [Methylosoma difficile]